MANITATPVRTSSVLAGKSHLPGVGGVVKRLLAPLLAPLRAALSLPRFDLNSSRTRFDILSAAADSHAAPKAAHIPTATVVFDTFASGTSTNKTRRREINNNKGFQRTCVTRFAWQVELDLWFAGWVLPFIDGICLFTRHMWPFEF